jgi:hypothetical protein
MQGINWPAERLSASLREPKTTYLNPRIKEQKLFLLLRNCVHFVPILLKLCTQLFCHGSISRLS